MPYVDPNTVTSPQHSWKLKKVLFDSAQMSRQGGWSVAEGEWEGKPCIGVRWNGDASSNGNPTSRGYATWFILPDGLVEAVLKEVEFLKREVVTCEVTQPEGYDFGAWRVVVTVRDDVPGRIPEELGFSLPDLPKRLCHPDQGYFCATGRGILGSLKNGSWMGHVYSNGVAEEENPTTIDEVRESFIHNIKKAIQATGG